MTRSQCIRLVLALTWVSIVWTRWTAADEPAAPREANRVKVAGAMELTLRERPKDGLAKGEASERTVRWNAAETAIIICDMWNDHYCKLSAQRVGVMAPRMNRVISAARSNGVMIIHAPSGTMDQYADTSYRRRILQAAHAEPPVPIASTCPLDSEREPAMPVDVSSPCDDPVVGAAVKVFDRQHAALDIIGFDGISDNGQEIYNFCQQEGIKNIAIMGVHTNMCILGRSFGIRQMVKLGMNVVLVRDLTDAMYDPRCAPYVSHKRGTELVIEHIETYWCPSIESHDLTEIIHGSDDPVGDAPAKVGS